VAGLVLAGGRSTRFGSEKALAIWRGRPLLMGAAMRMSAACSPVAISARPGSGTEALALAQGLAVLHDAPGDPDGPLAGVKAGLSFAVRAGRAGLAVLPCDAPLVPDDLVERLIQAAGAGAAVAETVEGWQPLCAVWPASALPQIEAALVRGVHPPIWRLLQALGAARVWCEPPEAFANLNAPADLAAAAARLG
jgi:molybdopterin-guanine dinucleotide biosynthesis protein A